MLEKTTLVLDLSTKTHPVLLPGAVPFEYPNDESENRDTMLWLDKAVWEDMGSPEQITATVESGDKLNTIENHAKIADFYDIFQGHDKLWYVRLVSNNGETIFTSEGYAHESHAAKIAADIGLPPREV